MKWYVEVLYQTNKGNPACKKAVMESDSEVSALNILTERVRRYKNCLKINGGFAWRYKII